MNIPGLFLQERLERLRKAQPAHRLDLIRRYFFRMLRVMLLLFLYPCAWLVRLCLVALRPWIHVRFGRYWAFSLGVWAVQIETYLCERKAGLHPPRALDLFYYQDRNDFELEPAKRKGARICNVQLDRMFRPKLRIAQWARFLDDLNRLLPHGSGEFILTLPQPHDNQGILDRFAPQLVFTPREIVKGKGELRRMGVDPESPFVLFHARDDTYQNRFRPRIVSLYGQWTPTFLRNASIENYLLAAEKLTQRGYTVIRMGKGVEKPIRTNNPRIIDYAWNHQSDFMDVFLSAHCAFFIGQNSGITALPVIFRRPIAFVNVFPLTEWAYCCGASTLFIPKEYYSMALGRLLTVREILAHPALPSLASKNVHLPEIKTLGIEIRENSPEEIADLVLEMDDRLHGRFQLNPEDDALREMFLKSLEAFPLVLNDHRRMRMGRQFLRQHRALFEERAAVSREEALVVR